MSEIYALTPTPTKDQRFRGETTGALFPLKLFIVGHAIGRIAAVGIKTFGFERWWGGRWRWRWRDYDGRRRRRRRRRRWSDTPTL